MGEAYIVRRGGSGIAALNFKIVGGTTQPANPAENTIWINSETAINGYAFNAVEPANPVEGTLWILTGATSTVAFNALKKETVMVYPSAARQYIGGAWTTVQAMTYQNGVWVNWILYLINNGIATAEFTTQRVTITEAEGGMTIAGTASGYHEMFTEVDLTGRTKLVVDGTFSGISGSGSPLRIAVWETDVSEVLYSSAAAYTQITASGVTEVDVSGLSGTYYVGICTVGTNKHTIYDLYLS